ncbi:MAG: hypothetical protein EOO76_03195 [Novosphingobium sp.]|nr:MAG: hypothetical protein EOO76_03195 [Novosphingobium sp.]
MNDTSPEATDAPRRRPVGCLLAIGLAVALGWWTRPLWDWENLVLPMTIETDAVLAADSTFGLLEGCQAAVYRLSDRAATRLEHERIGFLRDGPAPRTENSSNPYQEWRETPGTIDLARNGEGARETIFGLYAMGGCNNGSGDDFHSREISQALTSPGSFYTVTANREGIIIVAPKQKVAAYFYFG